MSEKTPQSTAKAITNPKPFDVLIKGQNKWTKEHLSLQEIIAHAESHDAIIAFLPVVSNLVALQVEKKLGAAFQVPPSFWRSISSEASSFFGSRGIQSTANSTSSIFYRLLIKEPVKKASNYPNFNSIDSFYTWHKLAFFISWAPQVKGKIKILCFDVPTILQEAITSFITSSDFQTSAQGPLDINNIIIEETVALFDKSVWLWRDVVRDLEKNRPMTGDQPPDPDYITMHELARHIIHSSETLSIAQETLKSMVHSYDSILSASSLDASSSENLKAELEQQASLLKCLQLRSQAVEARLKNEINLAFNLVAQYDSRSAVQISTNTATDSAAMKTISVLGLVFLPGTFICSIFSTTFFNFTPASDNSPQRWVISEKFWIYFVVAVPITLITIACWFWWMSASMKRAMTGAGGTAPLVRSTTIYEKKSKEGVTF